MENKSINKSSITLSIVAVVALLTAVFGATFAYFRADTNLNNLEFNVALPSNNSTFSCNGTTVSLAVTPESMAEGVKGNLAGSQNGTLTVSYLSGTPSTNTISCTYDIAYKWKSTSSEYMAPGSGKEFTWAVSGATTVSETQFVSKSSNEVNVKTGESISNASTTVATTKTYTITVKYYNLETDQSTQAGRSYIVDFYCKNIVC